MSVYITVLLLTAILAGVAEWRSKINSLELSLPRRLGVFGFVVVTLLAGVSALRWGVGTDYWNYYNSFPRYVAEASVGVEVWDEPGIRIIAWVVDYFNGDGVIMLSIAAILTIFLTVRSIWRWSPALTFGLLVYILSGSWYGSFNGVRQYLAAAIILAGHRHIIDRQFLRWIFVVAVASLFHISALVGVLLYFVPRKRVSVLGQIVIIGIAVIIFYGSSEILTLIETFHRHDDVSSSANAIREVNPLRVAFAFVPILLHWFLPKPRIIQENDGWFYVNMLLVFGAAMLAMSSSVFLARFVIFPQIFMGIGLAYITEFDNIKERHLSRAILLVLFSLFMYVEVSGSGSLSNFVWLFERDSSFS